MQRLLEWCGSSMITCQVRYALCLSEKSFRTELRRLKVLEHVPFLKTTHSNATVHYFDGPEGGHIAIVCMDLAEARQRDPLEVVGLLVHEAVHLFQADCERRGEDAPSKEYEAYAIQQISQNLLGAYREALDAKP